MKQHEVMNQDDYVAAFWQRLTGEMVPPSWLHTQVVDAIDAMAAGMYWHERAEVLEGELKAALDQLAQVPGDAAEPVVDVTHEQVVDVAPPSADAIEAQADEGIPPPADSEAPPAPTIDTSPGVSEILDALRDIAGTVSSMSKRLGGLEARISDVESVQTRKAEARRPGRPPGRPAKAATATPVQQPVVKFD